MHLCAVFQNKGPLHVGGEFHGEQGDIIPECSPGSEAIRRIDKAVTLLFQVLVAVRSEAALNPRMPELLAGGVFVLEQAVGEQKQTIPRIETGVLLLKWNQTPQTDDGSFRIQGFEVLSISLDQWWRVGTVGIADLAGMGVEQQIADSEKRIKAFKGIFTIQVGQNFVRSTDAIVWRVILELFDDLAGMG